MVTINDLIEDWIEIRSKLQQQLKALESGELSTGGADLGGTIETTRIRIKKWIDELNSTLKEYSSVGPRG